MSWWTSIRDAGESLIGGGLFESDSARKSKSGISGAINKIHDAAGTAWHNITGTPNADEKRNQQAAINEQIKSYKDASDLSIQELQKVQGEKDVQKRLINEKQIRSLRNNYRPSGGFLNNQNSPDNLGNNNQLTNKLGT